jgi:hypothetical protein
MPNLQHYVPGSSSRQASQPSAAALCCRDWLRNEAPLKKDLIDE